MVDHSIQLSEEFQKSASRFEGKRTSGNEEAQGEVTGKSQVAEEADNKVPSVQALL